MREQSILLVEDEEAMRMVVSDRLRIEGYAVDSARDGESGFAKATSLPFDLMILDVMLPGRNGFDLCRDIRQAGLATPILFLTALREPSDAVAGFSAGADGYITKPFEMGELTARVDALLRRAQRPNARPKQLSPRPTVLDQPNDKVRLETGRAIGRSVSVPNNQLNDFHEEIERRVRAQEGSGFAGAVAQLRKELNAEQETPHPPHDKALLGVAQGIIEFLEDAFRRIRSSKNSE
jgi:DNA-binding response OmpR family regulator